MNILFFCQLLDAPMAQKNFPALKRAEQLSAVMK
jgi:hypothetical protein